jgi:hypothetical protein
VATMLPDEASPAVGRPIQLISAAERPSVLV